MIDDFTIDWQAIAAHIRNATGRQFEVHTCYSIAGGCINQAYRIEGMEQNYFVKLNHRDKFDMFAAEAAGLAELAQPAVIKVPVPLCWGTTVNHAYLVMEYLALRSDTLSASVQLGHQLAVLHQVSRPPFGWHRDNYIGATLQPNVLENDWVTFWQKYRLGFQLQLAANNGYGDSLQSEGEQLLAHVGQFFTNYQPIPSLLHGDLWSGNYAVDTHNQPVIFDPAVYYGDRETDLAMTELFSGFPTAFYHAYQEVLPLDAGYSVRKVLYNLYHILNHLNLFGSSYLGQANRMIKLLLSELR